MNVRLFISIILHFTIPHSAFPHYPPQKIRS
ncbi:hypothetical protein M086_0433, partial [Bacteroides fragilis str. S13 L11]